jgi:Tfp pilus assembly protein FimT
MPLRASHRAQGTTLPELIVAIALIALVSGLVLPSIKRGFDRIQARGAARTTMMAFFTARAEAIAHGRRTVVMLDSKRSRVTVVGGADTLVARPIGADFGVGMLATRDSMTFFPDGLGLGGANLSVIITRGAAADTVIVSREGRVKLGSKAR